MPIFDVEANGQNLEIEAPSIELATDALRQHFSGGGGAQSQDADSGPVLPDLAKSGGIGLVKGVLGLGGLPATLTDYATQGVDYLAGTHLNDQFGKAASDYAGPQALQGYLEKLTGPLYQPKTTAGKYAQTVAEFAPAIVGGPGSLAVRAATRAVIPGLASEAAGQFTEGTPFEPYARLGGAVLGSAAPGMAARAVTPNPMSAERLAAANALRAEGVNPPASMVTGSKILKAAESELGGSRFDDAVNRMNEQFTAATLRRAGIRGETRATPDVINAAEDRIGQTFDAVAARNPHIPLDSRFSRELAAVGDDFHNLTGARSPLLDNFAQRIQSTGRAPAISGESYQTIQSDIARYARAAQQPELRMALQDMRNTLDAAIQRGLRDQRDAAEWRRARREWANLMVVSRAAGGSTEAAANGFITPAKLTAAIESMRRGTYTHGRGDFADLARAGNQIMKPYQDSGTPSRARAMAFPAVAGAVLGGGFGVLPGAAMAAVAPFLAGRAIMSRPVQAYLQNQRFPMPMNPARNAAVAAALALANSR